MVWLPYPFEGGFCITDDPDASTFVQTRAVYDHLLKKSIVTTKAVWAFEPEEACGLPPTPPSTLRGITLQDETFLSYCRELHRHGFELCPHGASAGNNRRERTRAALELFDQHFGGAETFICHSKNADNIYWEHKTTSLFPFHALLRTYSRHVCEGEVETSPYYWGDLCSSRVNQIRLYRTRCPNTLKRNPSMPYFDPAKPLVNGWFSATKRSLRDCTTEDALRALTKERGLTMLYQYLHRYAEPESGRLNATFVHSIERLASDSGILVGTVAAVMKRLRQLQGVFTLVQGRTIWLLNVGNEDVDNLQIVADRPLSIDVRDGSIVTRGCTIVVKRLRGLAVTAMQASDPVEFAGRNSFPVGRDRRLTCGLPLGKLLVNLTTSDWDVPESEPIRPGSFRLQVPVGGTGMPILSTLMPKEELRLIRDQTALIAREVLLRRRSLTEEKYLDASRRIPLEDHDNW